jgi:CRISPR-associated protein Cmr1
LCHLQKRGPEKSPKCTGTNGRKYPGLDYLSFPMGMSGGERTALAPSQKIKIDCVELKRDTPLKITGGYAMAFWALLTLGGIGARSRRGFGSLKIVSIDSSWKVAKILKLYPKIRTIDDWWKLLRKGLEYTNKWYGNNHQGDHFHIGKGTRFLLLSSNNGKGFSSWFDALDKFGEKLREIRKEMSPSEMAAIGLPIQGKGLEINAKKSERGASPLLMRVVKVEDSYYNLVILSRSPTCESNDTLEIKKGRKSKYSDKTSYGAIDTIWEELQDCSIHQLGE